MAKYKTCQHCGAHLDHGELCDCTGHTAAEREAAKITQIERACGPAIIGVDLAQGKGFTGKSL